MKQTLISTELACYLLAALAICFLVLGKVFGEKNKSYQSHSLANRQLGLSLGTASILATWLTSNTTMLAPQFAYEMGLWGIISYIGFAAGLFVFAALAGKIQKQIPQGQTVGDFIKQRYDNRVHRIFIAITLFYSLTWLVSMGMAAGLLLESLASIPYHYGITLTLALCVIYTARGGLKAVVGTDAVQSTLMLLGVGALGILALQNISPAEAYEHLAKTNPEHLKVLRPEALPVFFNTFFFGLGEILQGNIWWSRIFAMKKRNAQNAFVIAAILWIPVPIITGYLGLLSGPLELEVPRPDVVGPLVAANLAGQSGTLLMLVIVFCSLASSVDSLLAATADLITNDVAKPWLATPNTSPQDLDAKLLQTTKLSTLLLGTTTWLLCLPKSGTLATVLFLAGPMVGAAIWPIVFGLLSKKANSKSAALALSLGSAAGLASYTAVSWTSGAIVGTVTSLAIMAYGLRGTHHAVSKKEVKRH